MGGVEERRMSFSLPRFLRRTPPESLKRYFEDRQVAQLGDVDWNADQSALLRTLKQAVEALGEQARERVITDFERVDQLCNVVGQLALHSVVTDDPELLSLFLAADSDETRALIVLVEDELAFDRAFSSSYADSNRNGRSWSGYTVSAANAAAKDPLVIQELETEISSLFRNLDGSGKSVKIDHFDRQGHAADGRPLGLIAHYSIYAESLPESHFEFDRGEPKRRIWRPANENAISYSPERCTLEVVAKGGRAVRKAIAHAYARHVLGIQDQLQPIVVRSFALDHLKQPMPFPTDPVDGIKSVKVTLLRLRNMAVGYGRVTIEIDHAERPDIHAISAGWFGESNPLARPEWQVVMANLRIVFLAEKAGRRDKAITVKLRAPNGSNLKEQLRHHQIISEKYLAQWGLVACSRED
jgi:hypothetical protein